MVPAIPPAAEAFGPPGLRYSTSTTSSSNLLICSESISSNSSECLYRVRSTNRKGPPQKGGNPRPKTEAISPSEGVAMIPSSRHITASFTNRDTIRNC
eukprot:PDM69840.1 hypothetical protein PRIPAC_49047 [Pristionchus pacificus]